jgi:hypothetical protein
MARPVVLSAAGISGPSPQSDLLVFEHSVNGFLKRTRP